MVVRLRSGALHGGNESKQQAGQDRKQCGECEHAAINGEILEALLRAVSRQHADTAISDQEREGSAQRWRA